MQTLDEKAKANQYPYNSKFGMWAVEITEHISRNWFKKGYELCQHEYENKYRWIPVTEKLPVSFESGRDWDGLRSEEILFKDKTGYKFVGHFYSGFMDGSEFNDFVDISSFSIPNVTEWRFL